MDLKNWKKGTDRYISKEPAILAISGEFNFQRIVVNDFPRKVLVGNVVKMLKHFDNISDSFWQHSRPVENHLFNETTIFT